jgi:Zn-dependent metalloprotease
LRLYIRAEFANVTKNWRRLIDSFGAAAFCPSPKLMAQQEIGRVMMRKIPRLILCTAVTSILAAAAQAASASPAATQASIDRLKTEYRGAKVSVSPATGTARFVRLGPASMLRMGPAVMQSRKDPAAYSTAAISFVDRHAAAFGLRNASAELALRKADRDGQGQTHLTYDQQYGGLPVFGATLKAHFDSRGQLKVVNGVLVPDLDLSVAPTRSAAEAAASAVAFVKPKKGSGMLAARKSRLLIYREGLVKGVPGENRLAYEVEVGNGKNVREFVYVDAHTAKAIDRFSGTPDALDRRAYDSLGATAPGPNYPANPFWSEGDAFPTGVTEADNMIAASEETYNLFLNGFGRDSFDGAGATMDSIFNRGNACPNASWNGVFISFCPGTTSDDVTAHEWGHAYTEYTDGLIYAWQPGALNEAASDIFGETVDLLNGRQTDAPDAVRAQGSCVVNNAPAPGVTIHSPAAIAGNKAVGTAGWNPFEFSETADVVVANDGVAGGTLSDGCCAGPTFACTANSWTNAADVAGKIALVDRGVCGFSIKAHNALLNGAVGVIVANNVAVPAVLNMGVTAGFVPEIPALMISQSDGNAIKTQLALPTAVNATMSRSAPDYNNVRWLMGEDAAAFGGALRDMANPTCAGDPGKVSDAEYFCGAADNGGVHFNSGVDNHAYALMVDGGTFNGETVSAIGLTKAAHIYFRAKIAYQHVATDFADHADALEQSCSDLTGVNLASLATGAPSGQVISATDCAQVASAIDAVQFRTPPTQCNFQPLLAQAPPAVCPPGKSPKNLFADNFNSGTSSMDRWIETHEGTPDFTLRDWSVVGDLPDSRAGKAFFAPDPTFGTCAVGGDESSVLHLDSPIITLPSTAPAPRVVFDHWVATEPLWDGGNVKVSVNGGAWQTIPDAKFIYNAYNATINPAPANTNPLAGQRGFTGTDGGAVDGTWGRTIIDLAGIAEPKDRIQLRFDFGTDGCGGAFGWYIDDVQILQCR